MCHVFAGLPTGTNCWMWELDPVEGTAGWEPGKPLPGNLNMAYSTETLGHHRVIESVGGHV